jgi:hypothetical protein
MKLRDSPVVARMARDIGLRAGADPEKAIRQHCVQKVQRMLKRLPDVNDLDGLLTAVSSALRLRFEDVHEDSDIDGISQKYLAQGELIFATLKKELDNLTDGILFKLNNLLAGEPKLVAVIDCRGAKAWRAYFSKWHETAHVLTMPPERLQGMKRTPSVKKAPEEQIVDRVAGDLAFYSPIFGEALREELGGTRRVTFEAAESVRSRLCPSASRESTLRAAVREAPFPTLLLIVDYGLKRAEEDQLADALRMGLPLGTTLRTERKIRAVEVISGKASIDRGFRIFTNMEIPERSVIRTVFEEFGPSSSDSALEDLSWWKHSRGFLPSMPIFVEAMKVGNRVFGLITPTDPPTSSRN